MTNYSTGTTVKNTLLPSLNPTSPLMTGMLFSQRKLNINNNIQLAQSGTTQPSLYQPFYLGAYQNGLDALTELKKKGFTFTLGTSFQETIIPPSSVTINNITGITTLKWNSGMVGLQYLIGQNPTGAVTQGTAGGTLRNISVEGDVSILELIPVSGSPAFTTSAQIQLNATLANLFPNPKTSDPVCVQVYWFYEGYATQPKNTTSPDLWVSVSISGIDTSWTNPVGSPIALIAPATVVNNPDTSVSLEFPVTDNNLGLLPTQYFGNSTVTQATSTATGAFNGFTVAMGSNGTTLSCYVNVINVVGTFDHTDAITVLLDTSQNGFNYILDKEISSFALGANVHALSELTTTYSGFYNGILSLQSPLASEQKKYTVQGYFGYAPLYQNQYSLSSLVTPDTTAFKATVRLDIPTLLQYPNLGGVNAVMSMFMDLNNDVPYNACSGSGVIINQTASSNKSTYPDNNIANQLTGQGWTVLMPNSTGQLYPYRNVNCLQTNGGKVDNEYRFEEAIQKLRWVTKNLAETCEATCLNTDGTRKNNSPFLIKNVADNCQTILLQGNRLTMLGSANNSVDVKLSTTDITRLDVAVTTSLTSANSGCDITVQVQSFTI